MLDELIIAGTHSYIDFDASVKSRTIVDGKKKTIKETVPFSNAVYDFSKIDGELYWGEKSLQYIFEITADSPEELSQKISPFKSWVMNVIGERLEDPFIPNYHYIATFTDITVDESEVEKATITVTFSAYPYAIANEPKQYVQAITANTEISLIVENDSSHRITPTFTSNIPFSIKIGTDTFSVPSGETIDDSIKLGVGNVLLVLESTENGEVTITFHEEVF